MKTDRPTVKVVINKTKERKEDHKCPLYINVTWKYTRASEATGVYMTVQEFNKGKWKTNTKLLLRLNEIEKTIISLTGDYTARDVLNKTTEKNYLSVAIEKITRQHLSDGTAKALKGAERYLHKYLGKDYEFNKVTNDDIQYITRRLKEDGYAIGGIATILKNIKAVYSYADSKGYCKSPFNGWNHKADGYKFTDNPRALTPSDVTIIIRHWEKYHLMGAGIWLFSYYFCGVGLGEIMSENWEEIEFKVIGGSTYYHKVIFRKKSNEKATIVTQKNKYTEELLFFIKGKPWGNKDKDSFGSMVNYQLKKVNPSYTFYTARHTFCTQLVNSGIPLSQIASMMGRSPNTLATYIRQLTEVSDLKKAADAAYRIEVFDFPSYE